jgi:hypothetical protein
MNIPRTKESKRWKYKIPENRFTGSFATEILNPDYLQVLGQIVTRWPHIEDIMMHLFAELLGISIYSGHPVRHLYYSIVNARTRMDIMKSTLEESHFNKSRERAYDEILAEFDSLNRSRNTYVHGVWTTHVETGDIYLTHSLKDNSWLFRSRKVPLKELKQTIDKMIMFEKRVQNVTHRDALKRQSESLPQKSPVPVTPDSQ